ncbi:MAG: S4 domain-containing protein [Dictyoglomus sp.]
MGQKIDELFLEIKDKKIKEKVRELYDVFQKVAQKGGLYVTGFLSLTEQYYFQRISGYFTNELYTSLYGGVDGAERKRGFISDKIELIEYIDYNKYLVGISINPEEKISISFLKEIFEKNVLLDKVGDIWYSDGIKMVLASETLFEVQKILGENNINFELLTLDQLKTYSKAARIIRTTESSKRLDSIGGAALGISRSKMQTYIKAGVVTVNGKKVADTHYELEEGDVVIVQGLGNFKINKINVTPKGKFYMEIERSLRR